MASSKGFVLVFLLLGVVAILGLIVIIYYQVKPETPVNNNLISKNLSTPTPFNPYPYKKPSIPKKPSYVTFLVGDSMIKALGKNTNQLRLELIDYYPGSEFVGYNYGFGASNILTLSERLNVHTTDDGENFPPILKEYFDLIIIESFAYNPLSHLSIQEGLQKQTEILDDTVMQIINARPDSVIAIMTTIAPSKERFAQGVYELTPEERRKWAEERISYIENAINFAEERNLPLINVYVRSLNENGEANLKYINPSDYIHPSDDGILLISQTIADFIFENKIFPE